MGESAVDRSSKVKASGGLSVFGPRQGARIVSGHARWQGSDWRYSQQNLRPKRKGRSPQPFSLCFASTFRGEGKADPAGQSGRLRDEKGPPCGQPQQCHDNDPNLRSAKAKPILSPCKGQPGRIRQKVRGYLGGNPLVYSFAFSEAREQTGDNLIGKELKYQLRLTLSDPFAKGARDHPDDPSIAPLTQVLQRHEAALKCQYDAFADYVREAEAEGVERYPLYAWTKKRFG
jgi:hypothetical protein